MDLWRSKLPPGYRFKPNKHELIAYLLDKLHGKPLTPGIFNDVDVLTYSPQHLHDEFVEYMDNGCIHFFSERKFSKPNGKRERPTRSAELGTWKASGGAKVIDGVRDDGGVTISSLMRTLVFYKDKIVVDEKTGKPKKVGEITPYALREFMIENPKTGKIIDLALYQFYIKAANNKKKVERIDDSVATADAAVDHDDGQCQSPALPPQPEMAPVTTEDEHAAMDVNAFFQCYGAPPAPSCSQPEMENEPAAMDVNAFSQYYYGPSCSQPEMPAAQTYHGYSHVAPAAVDPISFLLPVNQDEGVYLNGAAYGGSYGGLADGMLVGQMGGAELIPWTPEQPFALQQFFGAEDSALPRPPEPCVAGHQQEGVGSNSGDDAPPSQTSTDLENNVIIGNGSDDADKKLSCTHDFLADGDPPCKGALEFCSLFMDE